MGAVGNFRAVGNFIDKVGTGLGLPELGISEAVAGKNYTTYSGITPQSVQAGVPSPYQAQNIGIAMNPATTKYYAPAPASTGNVVQTTTQPSQPQSQQSSNDSSGSGGGSSGWDSRANKGTVNGRVYLDENEYYKAIGGRPQSSGPSPEEIARQRAEEDARNAINTGFDAYISQLDQMLGNIGGQKAGQEQTVQNNYNQGISDINAQKESSMGDLATQRRKTGESQVKSLADIADNIRSLFQTGNVMLGTRGAGDSSAADRYSYAVTKLGSKQRGDVMAQTRSIEADIGDREAKLNNIVTQETAKLKTNRDNQILQVAQYFQDAQNQLLQMKAQGQLQRGQSLASLSTQLLQNAQQQLMMADADFRNKQNSLLSRAESISKTIGELKSNLAQIGGYMAPGIRTQSINGTPTFDAQGNMSAPLYFGAATSEKDKNIFGV